MNIVLITLIVCFFALTVFALVSMIILQRNKVRSASEVIKELDTALDTALTEINNLGALVQKEVEEKYQAMLFLYNLVEDKQKEISEAADSGVITEMSELLEQYLKTHGIGTLSAAVNTDAVDEAVPDFEDEADLEDFADFDAPDSLNRKRPDFHNPRHEQIWDMREEGRNVPDIAKELGMGQGEVKLILDLADRAS